MDGEPYWGRVPKLSINFEEILSRVHRSFKEQNKVLESSIISRSQWPRGLRCRSAAARLLRSWVRIPPGAWIYVCSECCVLSGKGVCDELITRPEESYRLWCVVVCDLGTSWMRRPWPALVRSATAKKKKEKSAIIIINYCIIITNAYYNYNCIINS